MSTTNPFPLNIVLKVNSPELVAALAQFGPDKYADANDFKIIIDALNYLYDNMGSGGGGGVTTLQELLTNGSTAGFNGIENPDAAFEVKMPFNTEDGLASIQTIVTPNSEVYLGIGIAHLVCNVALQYQISINHSKTIKIEKDIMIVADDNFDEGSYQNLEGISTFDTISGILTPSAYLIKAPIPKIGTVVNIRFPYKEVSGDYDLATKDELDLKADLVGGLVPSSQLPATVDEILEGFYVNQFYFETTDFVEYIPESNKYYLDLNSNKTYRWSGTQYVPINEGIALGETSSTAYRGDRGKNAYEHSQASGNPHGTTAAQVGAYTTGQLDALLLLKANITQVGNLLREEFTFSGSQTFTLSNNYGQVYSVEVQGQGALSTSQYTLVSPNQITILDTLDSGDYIVVIYSNAIAGIQPYYSQSEVDNLLNDKFDNPTGNSTQYLDGAGTPTTFPTIPSGFVPYTGANANVDLGEYELKASQIELDTTPTGTAGVAVTRWNDTIGSSETTLKGGNVILKNGVDLVARIVNKVTPNTTLTKASYQVVRISGAQGQRLAVNLAQANNDNNSADTLGIVTETIATNQEGFIMTVGQLENINTTGSLQGETWVDGDVLYLSPTTAGRLTNVKPVAPAHIVIIGYVEYAHANNGKIYVKVMNGWELDELHNVAISTPLNNQGLIYETSTDLWKNKTIIEDSITNGVTTIAPSQNAVFDALALKQNTLTDSNFGTFVNGLTAKNTLVDADEVVSDDSADSNKAKKTSWLNVWNNFIKSKTDDLYATIANLALKLDITSPSYTGLMSGIGTTQTGSSANGIINLSQTWNTTGTPTAIRLNVTDTASNVSSNLMDLRIGNVSRFSVRKSGEVVSPSIIYATKYTLLSGASPLSGDFDNGTQAIFNTSGLSNAFVSAKPFTPISGNASLNGFVFGNTINQTGGANGITRGLFINPTLTSAFDFRAIEVTGGKIVFSSTITPSGTTGAQTINRISGKVNAASGTTSLVVTNSLVTTSSIVMCQLGTNDTTCVIRSVVEANGSFTINYTAPTAETVIKFTVIN
jgi:nitrogen fixation protein